MDVFSAFPNAVVDNWRLGKVQRGTVRGDVFSDAQKVPVIVDFVERGSLHTTPDAAALTSSEALLYARPSDLPTTAVAALIAAYVWYDTDADQYYDIAEVGVGKNQETGVVEHYEFKLKATEVEFDEE